MPSSFDALHELLEAQAYRLAYWRTASHEINYRRFFDINTLAGLRVEHQEVFDATHQLLGAADSRRQGARRSGSIIPTACSIRARYFAMLQQLAARRARASSADRRQERSPDRPLYVVAEKILSGGEQLPRGWAVHGTTGYNFLNDLNGLFVDAAQARRTRRVYAKLTGTTEPFDDVLYASKRLIMATAMASELNVLAHMLDRIGESNRKSRDFTLDSLRDVITEVVACFPVYRTYVDEHGWTAERSRRRRARDRARAPAQPGHGVVAVRFLPRGRPAARSRRREPAPPGQERRGGYPPADERRRASGCASR